MYHITPQMSSVCCWIMCNSLTLKTFHLSVKCCIKQATTPMTNLKKQLLHQIVKCGSQCRII